MDLLNLGCGSTRHPDWTNLDIGGGSDVVRHDVYDRLPFEADTFDAVYAAHLLEHLYRFYVPILLSECKRVMKPGAIVRLVVPDLEAAARSYLAALEGAVDDPPYSKAMERYEWTVIELIDQLCRQRSGGEMLEYWKRNPMPAEDYVVKRCGYEAYHTIERLRKGGHRPLQWPREPLAEELWAEDIGEFRMSGQAHLWMYDRYSLRKLMEEAGFNQISQLDYNRSRIPGFRAYWLDEMEDGTERKPDSIYFEGIK